MIYPSADKLETWGSKYSLVVLAAKRAKQLKNGAPPLIETETRNPLTAALEEIAAGKVSCKVSEADLIIVPREEPELATLLALRKRELEEEPVVVVTSDEEDEIILKELEEDDEVEEEEELVIYSTDDEDEEEEAEPDNVVDVDAEVDNTLLEDGPKKKKAADEDVEVDVDIDLDVDVDDTEDVVDEDSEE